MIEVADAETLILSRMPRFPAEHQALTACSGRVLAKSVVAERDQPPFDRVTMDGIAIAYRDWTKGVRAFQVIGTQAAGAPPLVLERPGECVEVMTGAMLPAGADTIIPVERLEKERGSARVSADARISARQFVHSRGSDRMAGALLLPAGAVLGPPEMAVLASAGQPQAAVTALPHIAVVSTGDELVEAGEPLEPYQIRSTNDWAIEASLTRARLGEVVRLQLKDDETALADALGRLDSEADVLVLSGGVSMGSFDFVPAALERLGAKLVFHRIRQRPGKPMWFGISARGKPVFALPGNPVSTLVCATRYVVPALRAAAGLAPAAPELAALAAPVEASAELTYFVPVEVRSSRDGVLLATPRPTNTSGDFVALAGTQGFVELPARDGVYPPGSVARLFRW